METDISKLNTMAEDTVTHKKIVLDNCYLMFKYFTSIGEVQLGIDILKRGATHDNSKLENAEFKRMAGIFKSKDCFRNAHYKLSSDEKAAIENHWKKNRHHPEFFDDPNEMSELDIIEMVCDWFARSIQYSTDFLPFIIERQKSRFNFSEEMFEKVYKLCELMQSLYNQRESENCAN